MFRTPALAGLVLAPALASCGGEATKDLTYQGFTARDARITGAAGNKGTLFVRAILAKGRLYVLQFIGKGNDLRKPLPQTPRSSAR